MMRRGERRFEGKRHWCETKTHTHITSRKNKSVENSTLLPRIHHPFTGNRQSLYNSNSSLGVVDAERTLELNLLRHMHRPVSLEQLTDRNSMPSLRRCSFKPPTPCLSCRDPSVRAACRPQFSAFLIYSRPSPVVILTNLP